MKKSQMLIDKSPFTDIDINILQKYILNKYPEILNLPLGQVDELVKGIIDQIDSLYPNYGKYSLIDLYDILESELFEYQNEFLEQYQLEKEFQRSCDLQERQLIQYPSEQFYQHQPQTK